jgi:hypothetical protein
VTREELLGGPDKISYCVVVKTPEIGHHFDGVDGVFLRDGALHITRSHAGATPEDESVRITVAMFRTWDYWKVSE